MKNATRERSRVRLLRSGFMDLQRALPCIPPDTKLGELNELVIVVTELVLGVLLCIPPDTKLGELNELIIVVTGLVLGMTLFFFTLPHTKSGVLIERKLS